MSNEPTNIHIHIHGIFQLGNTTFLTWIFKNKFSKCFPWEKKLMMF